MPRASSSSTPSRGGCRADARTEPAPRRAPSPGLPPITAMLAPAADDRPAATDRLKGPLMSHTVELPIDVNTIRTLLPHRYPFLLVDRVVEFEAHKRVLAYKNV